MNFSPFKRHGFTAFTDFCHFKTVDNLPTTSNQLQFEIFEKFINLPLVANFPAILKFKLIKISL